MDGSKHHDSCTLDAARAAKGRAMVLFATRSEDDSEAWHRQFLQTFLERYLVQLGAQLPSVALWRFWVMFAHDHGLTWNRTELARAH